MNIHRRLILLVGLGMLLILSITVLSLQVFSGAYSHTTAGLAVSSLEYEKIWDFEKESADMSLALHNFVETGKDEYRKVYATAVSDARDTQSDIANINHNLKEVAIAASLTADLLEMEKDADRILSLRPSAKGNLALAQDVLARFDTKFMQLEKDIVTYQNEHAAEMGMIMREIRNQKVRTNLLFILILCTSAGFLLVFGAYIHRKVSIPLSDLWVGTEEISRGNLDYRIQLRGDDNIALLGERFNEMAQQLKESHADLERKLLDRTRELAALDSVALTLSQAGTLKDVLNKSLFKILESMSNIEPKGGIFLCEPGTDIMNLTVQKGLAPEFSQREETIKIGDCLCGRVAQTGEMLFTEQGCADPRHSRLAGEQGHSHIIIPIKSRGVVLGVIFLYPRKPFVLKPADVQMLEAIGVQLGMAVENFRFYAEVKKSSEKYWDLFENSRDILFTIDAQGRFTAVNKATEKFSGLSKVELSGKSILDFLTPEGAEIAKRVLAGESVGSTRMIEFEVMKMDGSHAFIEVSARKLFNGRQVVGFQVSARDVTDQKNLHEMLVKAERLGAIGQVGIAVRHEINNPLTTVIGNAELLIERYEHGDEDLKARLEMILSNALRIAEIVKRLEGIKQDKVVDYLKGVKMTDLKQG
jgi:PAS domain S-box-containing protein